MLELLFARYVYLMIVVLLAIGLYGMLGKRPPSWGPPCR
jgi:hypothetical protein